MTSSVVCSKNYLLATVNLTSHCYILRKFFEATKRCISCVYSRLSSYYSGSAFIITNIRHAKKHNKQGLCVCVCVWMCVGVSLLLCCLDRIESVHFSKYPVGKLINKYNSKGTILFMNSPCFLTTLHNNSPLCPTWHFVEGKYVPSLQSSQVTNKH